MTEIIKIQKPRAVLFAIACIILASCNRLDVYEKNVMIPGQEWKSNFAAKGSFTISDTNALYNIFLVLRHTDAYKYNNIWLNIGTQYPGDSMRTIQLDLELASDAQGWYGSGMNDIWEVRKQLNAEPWPFKRIGNYNFSISQIMRDDPLKNVMSAGLRVEKYIPR